MRLLQNRLDRREIDMADIAVIATNYDETAKLPNAYEVEDLMLWRLGREDSDTLTTAALRFYFAYLSGNTGDALMMAQRTLEQATAPNLIIEEMSAENIDNVLHDIYNVGEARDLST